MLTLIVLAILAALQGAVADYHIGFSLQLYSNPNNSLSDGTCCEETCSSCNTILFFCFRDSLHPHEDINRSTCFPEKDLERDTTATFTVFPDSTPQIKATFTGSFQLFVNVIHVNDIAGFRQGLSGIEVKLIDNVFLEFTNLTPLQFDLVSFVQTVFLEGTGDFGRVTIRAGVNVICALGFNGSDCSTFCAEDSTGNLICEQVNYFEPQPSTTMQETDSTPANDTRVILIVSVVIPVGVLIFAVFMSIGLILGFRYLIQKLKEYEKEFSSGFKNNSIKLEQKSVIRNTDSKVQSVTISVNVE